MYIMSVDKCRSIDYDTIKKIGIPSIVLMENAATEVSLRLKNLGEEFLILCGKGNNGGDGLAIARKLILQGKRVEILVIGERDNYTKDFKINLNIIENMKSNIKYIDSFDKLGILKEKLDRFENIVDCIFGIGINKEVRDLYFQSIKLVNESKKRVFSVDVPSGLNSDTGRKMGICIRADLTYTFEVIKKGFINDCALKYLGKLEVIPIGIPEEIKGLNDEGIYKISLQQYKKMIPKRKVEGYKGEFGKVIIVAGSNGFSGAAYLTTESCVKSGAGLVTLITEKEIQGILSAKLIEAMTINFEEEELIEKKIDECDVIAVGPGLSEGEKGQNILNKLIMKRNKNIVIDASGINIVSKNKKLLEYLNGRAVITPHLGEMARLLDKTVDEIKENRIYFAKKFANKYNIVVLLKGYNTIITNGEGVWVNPTGSSKMASGGMGDCLTGMIAAYIGQGLNCLDASLLAAFLHGYLGDELGKDKYTVTARDIVENIQNGVNKVIEL